MSRGARLAATVTMAVVFVALELLVLGYRGFNPASFTGVEIGVVVGLASLVLEIQIVERAMRSPKGDTASATFQTFALRLGIVAPLTFAFQMVVGGVDPTAFAVAYLVTFFVYLCWLTWKTYHAPVQYRAKPKQFAPRVVDRRTTAGSVR